jgi:hypothetical protein
MVAAGTTWPSLHPGPAAQASNKGILADIGHADLTLLVIVHGYAVGTGCTSKQCLCRVGVLGCCCWGALRCAAVGPQASSNMLVGPGNRMQTDLLAASTYRSMNGPTPASNAG